MELRGVLEIRDLQGHRYAGTVRVLQPQRLHGSHTGTAAPPLRSGYAQALTRLSPCGRCCGRSSRQNAAQKSAPRPDGRHAEKKIKGEKS